MLPLKVNTITERVHPVIRPLSSHHHADRELPEGSLRWKQLLEVMVDCLMLSGTKVSVICGNHPLALAEPPALEIQYSS